MEQLFIAVRSNTIIIDSCYTEEIYSEFNEPINNYTSSSINIDSDSHSSNIGILYTISSDVSIMISTVNFIP